MGEPLTRSTVIEFANRIINKTEYKEQVESAKTLSGLQDTNKLGIRWYHGFLNHHAMLLTTSGTVIKDVKRRTWVMKENFENIQKCV
jgi:hypothetical protein